MFSSNNFFAGRINDLQNTSLHVLVFLISINVTFIMKNVFAESA